MKRFFCFLYSLYAMLIFIALMLPILVLVVLASLGGKEKGGDMVYTFCRVWARIWYFLIGIRHKNIFLFPHDPSKQYIFIANHHSYQDIPALVLTVTQKLRILGKSELAKVPLFGFICTKVTILVYRQNLTKRAQSVKELNRTLISGRSIFVFPEGTFNESDAPLTHFYDGAFRIAIMTQTNIKPIIFPDTVKRMHWSSIFKMTPGKNRGIYLEEVNVQGVQMSDIKMLKEKVYKQMQTALTSLS